MSEKKGRWIEVAYDSGYHRCTACNRHICEWELLETEKGGDNSLPDYCPNCGAYMKEGKK